MTQRILIVGATSAIARETARCFAAQGASFFLAGRNESHLLTVTQDLKARGAERVETMALDFNQTELHETLVARAENFLGSFDVALIAYGTLPNQKACELDFSLAQKEFATNFVSGMSLLTHLANCFELQKSGVIAVISSVAGDRGRPSNYVYGSAKGALSLYLQGLRARLTKSGVHVLTIKPGFVATPMTAQVKKNFLFANPVSVGKGIHQAILKRRDVVYLPFFWRWIMLILKLVPESLFKRLNL